MQKKDRKTDLLNYWRVVYQGVEWPFEPEHQFAKHIGRRWKLDWANTELKLAIEIEGVVYRRGAKSRHQTAKGYEGDAEKYNAATEMGWRVLRYTPDMIAKDPWGVCEQIYSVAALCRKEVSDGE